MEQEISIPTPESMEFSHEPAGIGSRFIGGLIDIILQMSVILGLLFAAGASVSSLRQSTLSLDIWARGITILLFFVVFWGYHIIFETLWNGQTPGKRLAGTRILKDGGYPMSFLNSVVRNLLRPIDFLPFYYMVGAIVVMSNSRCKRIGDFAAGTIVVKERRIRLPNSLSPQPMQTGEDITIAGHKLVNLYELTDEEFDIIRQFMARRSGIQKDARAALARKIARPLAKKMDLKLEIILGREEEFLEKLARAYMN